MKPEYSYAELIKSMYNKFSANFPKFLKDVIFFDNVIIFGDQSKYINLVVLDCLFQ